MELILSCLLGVIVGVLTGLLPALPVFTGPMLLLYFANGQFELLYMLIFWVTAYMGSQYFGSIAVITTKIPGEESSAIYLKDIDRLTYSEKLYCLYDTARGSAIASFVALAFLWIAVTFINPDLFPVLLSFPVQLVVFLSALVLLLLQQKQKLTTLLLIVIGLTIGPKQNYALPEYWYTITDWFSGYTIYMVILGTIIIPTLFDSREFDPNARVKWHAGPHYRPYWSTMTYVKGTIVGLLAGLIPGPSASVATAYAYRLEKTPYHKIVCCETANNAAVITCLIPFFLLALPINQNTLIMSNLFDMLSIDIFTEIVYNINVVIGIAMLMTVCYFFLASRLIELYVWIIDKLHNNVRWIVLALLLALIAMDLQYSEISWDRYALLLTSFLGLGFLLKHYNVSAIPFLFSIILADKIVWLLIQGSKIYL